MKEISPAMRRIQATMKSKSVSLAPMSIYYAKYNLASGDGFFHPNLRQIN